MPFFDIVVRVETHVRVTSRQAVTIEAGDATEAARLATEASHILGLGTRSVRRLQESAEFLEVAVDGADGQVVQVTEADFRAESPEHRLLGNYKALIDVDGRGVSNGHILLWTEQAASLLPKATSSRPLPEEFRSLVARFEGGEKIGRHPGRFMRRYVTTVRQMYCVLLGDSVGAPALIVDVQTRKCAGLLMALRQDGTTGDSSEEEEAPALPEGWESGKPTQEAPFHFSPQGTLFPGR